jgi:hypothetical protein
MTVNSNSLWQDIVENRAELAQCIMTRKERREQIARLDALLDQALSIDPELSGWVAQIRAEVRLRPH